MRCICSDLEKDRVFLTKRAKRCLMLLIRNDSSVSVPKVAEDNTLFVSVRYVSPELLACSDAASAYNTGDDLASLLAHGLARSNVFSSCDAQTTTFRPVQALQLQAARKSQVCR